MSDVNIACGEACGGCTDECAACSAEMCADCGGCDHQRKLNLRARAATASLILHQIGGPDTAFGFNPLQKRGPDGRFIKMGGPGSAGGRRIATSRADRPEVDAHGIAEGTRAADLRDAQTERIRASKRALPVSPSPAAAAEAQRAAKGSPSPTAPIPEDERRHAAAAEARAAEREQAKADRIAGRAERIAALRDGIPRPRVSPENDTIASRVGIARDDRGRSVYTIAGRQRTWTTAEQHDIAEALEAVAAGGSVPPPIEGRRVSDGVNRATVEEVLPFRNRDGGVTLSVGRDKPGGDSGDLDMTVDEARELAKLLRETADREQADRAVRKAAPDPNREAAVRESLRKEKARVAARERRAEQAPKPFDEGPDPADFGKFTPTPDEEWDLRERRLKKRTPRLDPEGDLQPGDIVPTRDGKWQEVLGGPIRPVRFEGQWVNVVDDAKGYRHTEGIADIRTQIRRYAAEKAWRDAGGSKNRMEGRAPTPAVVQQQAGAPPLNENGQYDKPVKQYAVLPDGTVVSRGSKNPYQYVAQYQMADGSDAWVSWHRTRALAERGNLTGDQRAGGIRVKSVSPVTLEDPASRPPAVVEPTQGTPVDPSALAKGDQFPFRGEVVTVTGKPRWDSRENTWVVPTRNARGSGQRVALPGDPPRNR